MADDLILPGGRRRKELIVLEKTGTGALLTVPKQGDVSIETKTQSMEPVAGDWIIVQAEVWSAMLSGLMEARTLLGHPSIARRALRLQNRKDRRN